MAILVSFESKQCVVTLGAKAALELLHFIREVLFQVIFHQLWLNNFAAKFAGLFFMTNVLDFVMMPHGLLGQLHVTDSAREKQATLFDVVGKHGSLICSVATLVTDHGLRPVKVFNVRLHAFFGKPATQVIFQHFRTIILYCSPQYDFFYCRPPPPRWQLTRDHRWQEQTK